MSPDRTPCPQGRFGWTLMKRLAAAVVILFAVTTGTFADASAQVAVGSFAAVPVFGATGLASAVFMGGSVDQLETVTLAVGASGAWVQAADGSFSILIAGGPSFLKDAFKSKSPKGFLGPTAVTLVRTPTATATPSPTAATAALGRLNWGMGIGDSRRTDTELRSLALGEGTTDLRRQTRRILEVAAQSLGNPVSVVTAIEREGIVFSDPRFQASDTALKSIQDIYVWAMCARVADTALATLCTQRAGDGLDAWSRTYRSTGNPINDSYLIPMIQAVDLMCPVASLERCAGWQAWVLGLARRGDDFYAAMKPTDGRYSNNWASWRLLIRGMSGAVVGENSLVDSTRTLVAAHVTRNLRSDGSSIDFSERDALHYHVYDMEPLVQLVLYVPSAVDATTSEAIGSGVMFLRPFALGEQTHIEFLRTTVAFDIQRKQAGDPVFANMSWNPKEARQLLRLARTRFPAVRPWTESLVDENYSPRIKQLAALLEP